MGLTYFRRFRMEVDLEDVYLPEPVLPDGFSWIRWNATLLRRHAAVKYASFHAEIDSQVFPCLAEPSGCRQLMHEITHNKVFLPAATWLIVEHDEIGRRLSDCATIQGVAQSKSLGAIQNVGVIPECRGLGLGRALMLKSLIGFRQSRMRRVFLEVTAENKPAVELYRSLGFRLYRTMYKAAEDVPVAAR